MVTFELIEENKDRLIYHYYPEGNKEKKPGVIEVNRQEESVRVTKVAEGDWERDIPPDEINEMIDAINVMRIERGATDLEERVTEAEHEIHYGDHAVQKIVEGLEKGETPKKGSSCWY